VGVVDGGRTCVAEDGGADRIAATWYQTPAFTIDVNLTDGQAQSSGDLRGGLGQPGPQRDGGAARRGVGALLDSRAISAVCGGPVLAVDAPRPRGAARDEHRTPNAVVSGLFSTPPGGPASTSFPLKVGSDSRHLVDQNNVPFLVNGDAAWSLVVGLQKPDASVYLDDRRAKGSTRSWSRSSNISSPSIPPKNAYGDGPFTTPGDFSTPNEAYFAHADWVINEAASRGMLVLLTPAYLGFGCGGQGWCQEMNANGTTKMFNYGVYLGNRYKNFKNILWVHGATPTRMTSPAQATSCVP
jgi:hypothetical protein